MSFPRYPAYKDSGVEWLGEVPEHWEVKPLKAVTSINDEVLPESMSSDQEIEYVDIGSVSLTNGIERTETMSFGDAPSRARRIPRDGDVLVSTVRTYLKAIAPVVSPPSNLVASTGFAVIRSRNSLQPDFLKYALQEEHFIQQVISRSTGVSYPAINASEIAKIPICLPDPTERHFIAAFLDRETAKIDALIAEQQLLIELLQEKRQAVISHAVTKGLNPNAPMKESGVEWLGEVPEHWKFRKFGWDFQAGMGQTILREDLEQDGVPVFSATEDDSVFGHLTNPAIQLEAGDLVIPARGNCIGAVKLIRSTATCTQTTIYCKTRNQSFKPEYVFAYLQAKRDYLFPMTRTAIPQITVKEVMSNLIPLPPLEEQEQIERCISDCRQTHDELIDFSQRAILLLQERRSALISAAVTGQIDVRGLMLEVSAT